MADYTRFVIGIDGGGTKTHVLLVALDGTVIAEIDGGPTNLQNVGISQASRTLFDLILECCKKAGCEPAAREDLLLAELSP